MDFITDVLIVGTGIAGLYAALNLRKDLNIIMVSKSKINECNSSLAQGGIAVARGEDDFEVFIEDTLRAGRYENKISSLKVLVEESMENIEELIKLGVDFEEDENGLCFTKEAAHSINRIVYHKDITGKRVHEVLLKNVLKKDNIKIIEECELIELLEKDNSCSGAIFIKDEKRVNIYSKKVILATGGLGGLFKNSTNERIITGDSIGIALRKGIKVKNLEYIQFHPTSFFNKNNNEKKFLISESVRGEGGKLINCYGERFVDELLPRDVVTKHIYEEMKRTKSENVFLDVSFMDKGFLKNRFPNIYKECLEAGIDISKKPIPVVPAQHYFMGGIEVDLEGKTSMKNLYAFGEVSCTGVHGANRLASNSLLEALVFSRRGALEINKNINYLEIIKENKVYIDLEYYKDLNRKVLLKEICNLRGDIINELVTCRGECKKSS